MASTVDAGERATATATATARTTERARAAETTTTNDAAGRRRRPMRACLIVMCGKPSSGKTKTVRELAERLELEVETEVVVADEAGVNARTRDEAYENATTEKMIRGALRSEVDRVLHTSGPCVILDSMNAIKGFRYELWCAARAVAARYCVVYVESSDERCTELNRARRDDDRKDSYSEEILRDLCYRFEHPIAGNRWDSPLFTFRPATDTGVHREDLFDAICAHVRGDATRTTPSARALVPNKATQNAPLSDTNWRYEMDRATQDIIDAILSAQELNGGCCCSSYTFGEGVPTLRSPRVLTLAELRRRKRDFLQLASKSLKTTRQSVQRLFVDELQRRVDDPASFR